MGKKRVEISEAIEEQESQESLGSDISGGEESGEEKKEEENEEDVIPSSIGITKEVQRIKGIRNIIKRESWQECGIIIKNET